MNAPVRPNREREKRQIASRPASHFESAISEFQIKPVHGARPDAPRQPKQPFKEHINRRQPVVSPAHELRFVFDPGIHGILRTEQWVSATAAPPLITSPAQ